MQVLCRMKGTRGTLKRQHQWIYDFPGFLFFWVPHGNTTGFFASDIINRAFFLCSLDLVRDMRYCA